MQPSSQSFFAALLGKFTSPPVKLVKTPASLPVKSYQQEIEALCQQLFRKRSLVTSGRLQLIGLEKIRRRLGASWKTRYGEICKIADEVILAHLSPGDIHLRCKEDTFLIIFANATPEEGEATAAIISAEISKRFFSGQADLRGLSITKHVVQTKTSIFEGRSFTQILDMMAGAIAETTVTTSSPEPPLPAVPDVEYEFLPVWDVRDSAVASYICHAKTSLPRCKSDFMTLLKVMAELHASQEAGRKNVLVCPVSYDTLCRPDQHSRYEQICSIIPPEHRRFLSFRIEGLPSSILKMGGARVTFGLKKYGRSVTAEIKAEGKMDFTGLLYSTFSAAELNISAMQGEEQATLKTLQSFLAQAVAAEIPKTAITNVSSLSVATAAVCMGFDALSGPAVQAAVPMPQGAYPFHHRDLFKN